ncbi:MAG: hypothetical protein WA821_01470 [Anaerolineales bacterium]
MKKLNNDTPKTEEGFKLLLRPRATGVLAVQVPVEALASLERVAASRDMSVQALVKLYIGQGLRQDLAKLFADRVLETTAQVLTRHIHSEEEVSAILREIRGETTPS